MLSDNRFSISFPTMYVLPTLRMSTGYQQPLHIYMGGPKTRNDGMVERWKITPSPKRRNKIPKTKKKQEDKRKLILILTSRQDVIVLVFGGSFV